MTRVRVRNADRGTVLAERARVADSFWRRLVGLLGTRELARGEGLILEPCTSVHMLGMRYAIDVAFLDAQGRIVAAYQGLAPGRWTSIHRTARAAVELPAGTLSEADTRVGDRLVVAPGTENGS